MSLLESKEGEKLLRIEYGDSLVSPSLHDEVVKNVEVFLLQSDRCTVSLSHWAQHQDEKLIAVRATSRGTILPFALPAEQNLSREEIERQSRMVRIYTPGQERVITFSVADGKTESAYIQRLFKRLRNYVS